MRFGSTIIIALRALRRNKLRSVLTALGIIIGIGAVIAMVSIGNGAKSQVEAQVASLGQNVITVFSGSINTSGTRSGWGGAATLTLDDADAIAREVSGIAGVSPEVRDRSQVLANGLNWNTQIQGESPDYITIRSWPVAEGSMFTEQDVRSVAKVCVVGKTVVDQLFPETEPIGQTLRIRNIPFKIVGVLSAKGFNLFGQDQDDVVLIPYTSHMKRITRRTNIASILIQADSPEVIDKVQQSITDTLMQRRKGRDQDFTVRNQVELAEAATKTTKTMTVLLGAIACISLVVGGIGIMNIMLVSVTERTREIGIRLAVGAHGRDVLLQFIIEAVILSVMGGILGVLLGIGSSQLISFYLGWPVLISTLSVAAAVSVSAVIGIFFGYYPAMKAAELDPIDALRYE
ncbi:MAG: ABC transporter permease [Verrucomicrobia bacterium]|nr:ABC transporter permease [Verrucomicrobiota bacterium]